MSIVTKGRYQSRIAQSQSDIHAAQRLRHLAFAPTGAGGGMDADSFDASCTHVLVEEVATKRLVCCFRVLPITSGAEISRSYSAQFYDVSAFETYKAPMVEMGRFCVRPQVKDCDVIRTAWAAMTRYVDENNIKMLFGCVSFQGIDVGEYGHALTLLRHKHLAPKHYTPRVKACDIRRFCDHGVAGIYDHKQAIRQLPPLLRSYLAMGGWVSDHAVVDRHMNTLHVFTGLEISAIPAKRQQLLRALTLA